MPEIARDLCSDWFVIRLLTIYALNSYDCGQKGKQYAEKSDEDEVPLSSDLNSIRNQKAPFFWLNIS